MEYFRKEWYSNMTWIEILIQFVIPMVFSILIYKIIPMVKQRQLYDYVKIGVYAAQQLYAANENKEKFEHVKKYIQNKFKISEADLENIIEACVHAMKKKEFK